MNLPARFHITPAVHVRLSVDGHPEFERVIELPAGSSTDRLVSAYLLSLGMHDEDAYDAFDVRLDLNASSWRPECQTLRVAQIPHDIHVLVMDGRMPDAGDPCVAIVGADPDAAASCARRWQTDAAPFRVRHVNSELAEQFGVVVPYFDDSDLGNGRRTGGSARFNALVQALTPARRLALLAHLDDSGIFEDRPLDLNAVESAVASLTVLFGYVGTDGLAQDPESGWVADSDIVRIMRALGWDSADEVGITSPAEALLSFARDAKLLRRFKGRIIVTTRGRELLEPGPGTLRALASAVAADADRHAGWYGRAERFACTLAVLAIADGSAQELADIPAVVALGDGALNENRRVYQRDSWDDILDHATTDAGAEVPADVRRTIERITALSEPGQFGVISPGIRAVARAALR